MGFMLLKYFGKDKSIEDIYIHDLPMNETFILTFSQIDFKRIKTMKLSNNNLSERGASILSQIPF
jgi:hypothetical protein